MLGMGPVLEGSPFTEAPRAQESSHLKGWIKHLMKRFILSIIIQIICQHLYFFVRLKLQRWFHRSSFSMYIGGQVELPTHESSVRSAVQRVHLKTPLHTEFT
jgi:hypothetical protein